MRTLTISLLFLATVGLAAGCGDYSNPQLKEDLEFLSAIPAKEVLDLRVADPTDRPDQPADPNGSLGSSLTSRQDALIGDPADFYESAEKVTTDINGGVLGFLQLVDWITHRIPPTRRELNRRVWGPWPSDDVEGVDVRFDMHRYPGYQNDDPDNSESKGYPFSIHFQMRPAEATDGMGYDEGWVDCVSGHVNPKGFFRRGDGTMYIDLTACAGVTGSGESGTADITFHTAPDADNPRGKTQVDIVFDAFYTKDAIDSGDDPLSAEYSFFEGSDHSGRFDFKTWADAHGGLDPQLAALETFEWRVRWGADGCGRADALVYGGDLGDFEIPATECWGPDHGRVYFSFQFAEPPEPTEEGDPADCCLPSAFE